LITRIKKGIITYKSANNIFAFDFLETNHQRAWKECVQPKKKWG
jgi:hypothetical protein